MWSAYPFKFFKGRFPQILLGPFLNTLSHIRSIPGDANPVDTRFN